MGGRAKVLDPDKQLVYFAGSRIQGFADGEFITAEPITPSFQDVAGTDGEVARSKSNDRRWKVVIKLLQTSSSNLFMSAIHNADLLAANGSGIASFSWTDLQGGSFLTSAQAWITKWPEKSGDRTAKSREWELHLADADHQEGGN